MPLPQKFLIEKVNLKLGGLRQKDLDAILCQSRNVGRVFNPINENSYWQNRLSELFLFL